MSDTPGERQELSLLEIQALAEDFDLEVKKAAGREGKGELPASFYESYVAMANTAGGLIFLGIEEKPEGVFRASGIGNPQRVVKSLWDGLNNRQRVSVNLLANQHVEIVWVQGQRVIRVWVPRATRSQRPVFLGHNPLTGTYRRNYQGDYRCDEETVRRMLAEQVEDARDARLLQHFGFEDLDESTLKAYRNQFKATRPDHPWLDHDDREFLRCIGGWTRDRETNQEGLSLAGLLMFGKLRAILGAVPHYVVDYQEQPEARTGVRWTDRVTTDGTWSGNLYDFYRRVIQKLFSELKVPFVLRGAERVDETSVHEALREALVNTLIHADYTGRASILVVKRPHMFGFRNPGTMRLPLEEALRGGISDCRNRNLQRMFQHVGAGDQAGSGIPKIYHNWKQQHWRLPELWERLTPDQTLLVMRKVSLLPEETIREMDQRFGPAFHRLSEVQRLALATVAIEGKVTHARLKSMTAIHPHDLTKALAALVRDGFLDSAGATRGTFYFFPGEPPEVRENSAQLDLWPGASLIGGDPFTDSEHLAGSSEHLALDPEHLDRLRVLAALVKASGKVDRAVMEQTIEQLCQADYLPLRIMAELLDRSPDTLRVHYLNQMVKAGRLEHRYPGAPNHPHQAYRTQEPR